MMRIRIDVKGREDRLRRLMEATGEATKVGALDVAAKHYLADLEAKEDVVDVLPADVVDELSTPWIPLERETSVGRS